MKFVLGVHGDEGAKHSGERLIFSSAKLVIKISEELFALRVGAHVDNNFDCHDVGSPDCGHHKAGAECGLFRAIDDGGS